MAGVGVRFKQAGYNRPKYEIEVRGISLFDWSLKSLNNFRRDTNKFFFMVRQEDKAKDFISKSCRKNGIKKTIIYEIIEQTDGQATTALCAKNTSINKKDELVAKTTYTYNEEDKIIGVAEETPYGNSATVIAYDENDTLKSYHSCQCHEK